MEIQSRRCSAVTNTPIYTRKIRKKIPSAEFIFSSRQRILNFLKGLDNNQQILSPFSDEKIKNKEDTFHPVTGTNERQEEKLNHCSQERKLDLITHTHKEEKKIRRDCSIERCCLMIEHWWWGSLSIWQQAIDGLLAVGLPPSPYTHRGILDSPEGFFFRQRRCSSVKKRKEKKISNKKAAVYIRSSKRDRWSGTCRKRGPVGSISLAAVALLFHRS